MTDQWQTKLDTYSGFPRCCKWFQEMNDHTDMRVGTKLRSSASTIRHTESLKANVLGRNARNVKS